MGGPKLYNGPLNYEDERELVQLFFEMIVNEKQLEKAKMDLAECSDYNLVDGFSILDGRSLGWVSAPQIYSMFMQADIFAHKDDIYNYVRRFDRDMDSKMLYSDFCESFTPKDPYYAHAVN